MSEEKYTPGPWVRFGGDQLGNPASIISDDSSEAIVAAKPFIGDPRDDNDSTGLHVSLEVKEADLKLILAAPELLEACELFLKALASRKRGGLSFDPTYADWDTVKYAADKAIAKAEDRG